MPVPAESVSQPSVSQVTASGVTAGHGAQAASAESGLARSRAAGHISRSDQHKIASDYLREPLASELRNEHSHFTEGAVQARS